jgi:hypothetical protein
MEYGRVMMLTVTLFMIASIGAVSPQVDRPLFPPGGEVSVLDMRDWTIVSAPDAIPSEVYAAKEFQSLFKLVSGTELPIKTGAPDRQHNIFIGTGAEMQQSPVKFDVDDLGDEGLRIKVKRHNIAIAGGRPRGTLYGVYEFFEEYLGVRYLTCDHTYVSSDAVQGKIPCGTHTYVPPFSFRWSFYKENFDRHDFATRLRVNTVANEAEYGGRTPQDLIGHSYHKWINPETYGKTHPEYFAMRNGVRKLEGGGGGPEPCVTNPEVLDIVAEGVIKELEARPGIRNIAVSQNDNDEYCQCPKCEEINKREDTPMGSNLIFVNAVAERVEKRFPDVKVGTLAYWYTRKPPRTIVPRKNVEIQLCSIECCTLHAIDDPDCAKNKEFCKDVAEWRAICNDIWIWNYNTDFACYDLPFPNLRSIGRNVEFFLNNNAKGVFMQANGNGNTGEMCDLRNYVISRCLWKPGRDSWKEAEEFCKLHYANAGTPVMDYLTMLHDNAEARKCHPGCFPSSQEVGLDREICARAIGYFEKALQVAESDVIRNRVEKASICAYKGMLCAVDAPWEYKDGKVHLVWPDGVRNVAGKYVDLARKHNLTMAAELTPASEYFAKMEPWRNGLDAVCLENDVWKLILVPTDNARVLGIIHKPTNRNLADGLTQAYATRAAYEEVWLEGFGSVKTIPFSATLLNGLLSLEGQFPDGSRVTKTIAFDEDNPSVINFCTTFTASSETAKEYQFKVHPELRPESKSVNYEDVSVYYKTGGAWVRFNKAWMHDSGPDAEVLMRPGDGAFAFFSRKVEKGPFGVMLTYDPARVGKPYLWWKPEWDQLNLELFTPKVSLKKGESLTSRCSLHFLAEAPK